MTPPSEREPTFDEREWLRRLEEEEREEQEDRAKLRLAHAQRYVDLQRAQNIVYRVRKRFWPLVFFGVWAAAILGVVARIYFLVN